MSEALPQTVRPSIWRTIVTLFKLRIVALLLLSAFAGAALALGGSGSFSMTGLLMLALCGGLSAAGSSALNQYLERDQDRQMARTSRRPFPSDQISSGRSVAFLASGMIVVAVTAAAFYRLSLAFWVLAGAVIYVGVYTMWLKPRTSWNIVIGGAAGSCAVISGGAALGDWRATGVWLLAGLLFVWTPVHFWSLAMAYRDDYAQAAFPMLPVQVSPTTAARWTALHGALTVLFALALGLWPSPHWWYLLVVVPASGWLLHRSASFVRHPERQPAMLLFHTSNLYLTLILVAIMIQPG